MTLSADETPKLEANARPFASRAVRNATSNATKQKMAKKRAEWRAKMDENASRRAGSGERTRRAAIESDDDVPNAVDEDGDEGEEEDVIDDVEFSGGLSLPGDTYERLLPHQKTCLKWLWELHCQRGGIIGADGSR